MKMQTVAVELVAKVETLVAMDPVARAEAMEGRQTFISSPVRCLVPLTQQSK
jgi:hypothetical protein